MRSIVQPIDSFIRAMVGDLNLTGRTWARVGIVALVVAAAMSADFGWQVSWKHGVFLACLTFVAAFGPEAAYRACQEGKYGSSCAIAIFSAFLLAIQLGVDQSYTAGIRGHNVAEAKVSNVRYDNAQEGVSQSAGLLKLWQTQLADLQAQAPWAATVKADALRDEVKTLDQRIANEIAGGRGGRKAGCKTECERLQNERKSVFEKIVAAEQMDDLRRRIDATQRLVDAARAKADTTEHKSSAVAHANKAIAKAVAYVGLGSIEPSQHIQEGADIGTNFAMAVAATGVPAFCLFVAGLYRKQDESGLALAPPAPTVIHNKETVIDESFEALKRWAKSPEARKLAI